MENNQVLLSICIPTYNRAYILDGNLTALSKQIAGKNLPIEVIVSDNCSSDDTPAIVKKHIDEGMPINYIRNNENLGMDGNFAQCYRKAGGKYILALGDDDYLMDRKLGKLLSYLKQGDYGLVHLRTRSNLDGCEVFDNNEMFLKNVSFWITYITSNIVNSEYVAEYNFEQYFGTYLTIMPLYLNAITMHKENLIIHERIFADGLVSNTNGGYNFFEVFSGNYLRIWQNFVSRGKITTHLYKWIKRDIFKCFLLPNIYNLLVKKDINNYRLDNSWKFILKQYGFCFYFYYHVMIFLIKRVVLKFLFNKK